MLAGGTADSLTPPMTRMGTPPDIRLPFPAQRHTDNSSKANVTYTLRDDRGRSHTHTHTHTHTDGTYITHTHTGQSKSYMMYEEAAVKHTDWPTSDGRCCSSHMLHGCALTHTVTHTYVHSALTEIVTFFLTGCHIYLYIHTHTHTHTHKGFHVWRFLDVFLIYFYYLL